MSEDNTDGDMVQAVEILSCGCQGSWVYPVSCNISWGPFYQHGLTLIPALISNYVHCKVWGEITYPFLNFNGCTVEV